MTDFKPQLIDLPSRPSEVSRSACEAAEELYEMGARGEVSGYVVVAHQGSVTLDLLMQVPRDAYEQLPAFRRCLGGCRLRVYIVQERE